MRRDDPGEGLARYQDLLEFLGLILPTEGAKIIAMATAAV